MNKRIAGSRQIISYLVGNVPEIGNHLAGLSRQIAFPLIYLKNQQIKQEKINKHKFVQKVAKEIILLVSFVSGL